MSNNIFESPDEAWAKLSGQPSSNSASTDAWDKLTPGSQSPSFFDGMKSQIIEELNIPTAEDAGATVVRTIFQAINAGQEEWRNIQPPTTPVTPTESAPVVPEVVRNVSSFISSMIAAAAGVAAASVVENIRNRRTRSGNRKSGLVPSSHRPTNDSEIIDVIATEVKE